MKKKSRYVISTYKIIEIILIFFWLITIQNSDSLYIPYLIIGISSIVLCLGRQKRGRQKTGLATAFSLVFTFFVCTANYTLFPEFSVPNMFILNLITVISLVVGSFISFYNILISLPNLIANITIVKKKSSDNFYQLKPRAVFFISFSIIAITYLLVLFLCKHPGNLSVDSIRQITQNITGEYSNHHPFIHTILIGFFINLGQNLFNNINSGVALYSIFQILFMSSIFSYSLVTLYQKNCSKKVLLSILLLYMLCPYHIMYSMTMWKDIMFGGFALLFLTSQYRSFHHIGNNWLNYALITLSSLGVCLFRNNGFYAMIVLLIIFVVLFWRKIFQTKKLLLNFSLISLAVLFTFVYNKALLPALNVAPHRTHRIIICPRSTSCQNHSRPHSYPRTTNHP